jgi:hypothetical protein
MIAQDSGKPNFLIDGIASHGNSGSPVFAIHVPDTRLAGMVTSFHNDQITLLDEDGHITAALPYNSGLTSAVKSTVILNALREALKHP